MKLLLGKLNLRLIHEAISGHTSDTAKMENSSDSIWARTTLRPRPELIAFAVYISKALQFVSLINLNRHGPKPHFTQPETSHREWNKCRFRVAM